MANLGGFDIVLHLRQDVLGDILLRVVNASRLGQGMTAGQLTLPRIKAGDSQFNTGANAPAP